MKAFTRMLSAFLCAVLLLGQLALPVVHGEDGDLVARNTVYTFEELLIWLEQTDLLPKPPLPYYSCGCPYDCSELCRCGEDCTCGPECGCDCNNSDPGDPYWPCGCAYDCDDGCFCDVGCGCTDCGCICAPYYPCGCAYWCEDGCRCEDGCKCIDCGCDCQPFYPCGCNFDCESSCACGENCECVDCGCECQPPVDDPWPCGCAYYCRDGCVCAYDCECGLECGCDCAPLRWSCGCPDNCLDGGCVCGDNCTCGPSCGCECALWPCGCSRWEDVCVCGGSCRCENDACGCYCKRDKLPCGCFRDCDGNCICEGDNCYCIKIPESPRVGDTVYFGADIVVDLDTYNGQVELDGVTVEAGEFSLIIQRGTVSLRNGTIKGSGVDKPLVTVAEDGWFIIWEDSTVSAEGDGCTAVLMESEDRIGIGGVVSAKGAGATAIRASGDFFYGTQDGYDSAEMFSYFAPFNILARGEGSIGIDAVGDVGLCYGTVVADGQSIRAGGSVFLDTCVVRPAVDGAELHQRTVSGLYHKSDLGLWLEKGAPFADEDGLNPFERDHEMFLRTAAPGLSNKYFILQCRWGEVEVDTDVCDIYYAPILPLPPYDAYNLIGPDSPQAGIYVYDPRIPQLTAAEFYREIDWNTWEYVSLAKISLIGAPLDDQRHTLLCSYDEGETWEVYPWEKTNFYYDSGIYLPVEKKTYTILLKLEAPEGSSYVLKIELDENGKFYSGPPLGDRWGDRDGNKNPPILPPLEPEPEEPVTPPEKPVAPEAPPATDPAEPEVDAPAPDATEPEGGSKPTEQATEPTTQEIPATQPAEGTTPPPAPPAAGEAGPSAQAPASRPPAQATETAPPPADPSATALTGAELKTLLEAKGEYVPFYRDELTVWVAGAFLEALDLADTDVLAVRTGYTPGQELTVTIFFNDILLGEWPSPVIVGIPWDGREVDAFDGGGNAVALAYSASEGVLRLTLTGPGALTLVPVQPETEPATEAPAREEISLPKPEEVSQWIEDEDKDTPVKNGVPVFAVAGILTLGGAGGGTALVLRHRRRKR